MMEEKILEKVVSLVNYLIAKPNEAFTYDDYMILSAEFMSIKAAGKTETGGAEKPAAGRRIRY